jgi:hypothetical protein
MNKVLLTLLNVLKIEINLNSISSLSIVINLIFNS